MEYPPLCGNEAAFYMETNGIELDISDFKITDYGLSKQHTIEVTAYCPLEKLSKAFVMWQKTTLVINHANSKHYFHGIIVEENTQNIPAPNGYLASKIRIASQFWWLARSISQAQFHHKNNSEFIDGLIEASGMMSSQFKKSYLDELSSAQGNEGYRKLRMANGRTWAEFINEEFAKSNVITRSVFNNGQETIEFIGNIDRLDPKNLRSMLKMEKHHIDETTSNAYFGERKKQTKTQSQFFINTVDPKASPGEWLNLYGELYQVINVEISGHNGFTFDNTEASRVSKPEILSHIALKPAQDDFCFPLKKPEKTQGFSIYTGRVEASTKGINNISRDLQGHYNVRLDCDSPIDSRSSDYLNKNLQAQRGEALQNIQASTISGGTKKIIDMPLHDGAEVALIKVADEEVVILGALNNARAKSISLRHYNVLRTREGNQLVFGDVQGKEAVALETYKQYNSVNFNNGSGEINVATKKGKLILDAKKDFLIHTPATIALKFRNDLNEKTSREVRVDAFRGDIQTNIKHQAYLTAIEKYKIEVKKIMIDSEQIINHEASSDATIHCEEFILNADNDIELEAKKINITTEKITLSTPGSSTEIKENLLDLRAKDILIDIKQAAHNTNEITLGGSPQAPLEPSGYDLIKETPQYQSRLDNIGSPDDKSNEIRKEQDNRQDKIKKGTEKEKIKKPKSLVERIKEKEEKEKNNIDDGIEKTFEIKKSYKRKYKDYHACWININEGELELNLKAKISNTTNQSIVVGLSSGETCQIKIEDKIAKIVSGNSEATLTKNGKLTLTTQIPSLKGESFSVECGLDPETKLPYAAASISYEFYDYKLETKYGTINLTGTLTFKNTFNPKLENGMCHLYVPSYRIAQKALPVIQGAAMAGGLLIAAPEAGAIAGTSLGKLAPILAVSVGGLLSSSAFASSHSHRDKEVRSRDKKIIVTFNATIMQSNHD